MRIELNSQITPCWSLNAGAPIEELIAVSFQAPVVEFDRELTDIENYRVAVGLRNGSIKCDQTQEVLLRAKQHLAQLKEIRVQRDQLDIARLLEINPATPVDPFKPIIEIKPFSKEQEAAITLPGEDLMAKAKTILDCSVNEAKMQVNQVRNNRLLRIMLNHELSTKNRKTLVGLLREKLEKIEKQAAQVQDEIDTAMLGSEPVKLKGEKTVDALGNHATLNAGTGYKITVGIGAEPPKDPMALYNSNK